MWVLEAELHDGAFPSGAWERGNMPHEIRNRVIRSTTPEEAARHKQVRGQIEQELPELTQWAQAAAARHRDRVAVGTVLSAEEANMVAAIDEYAAMHSLNGA